MKAGLLQFRPEFGKPETNIEKIRTMLEPAEFDLVVIPELANSGYFFSSANEVEAYSEDLSNGAFISSLKEISKQKSAFVVSGVCEKSNGKYFNTSVLICPSGRLHAYRKIHLFDTEKKWFTPGSAAPEVYEIEGSFGKVKLGMMICFDWFFPETARTLALQGAQIICHPSNLVLSFCQRAMFTRAVENRVFTITANRTGAETSNDDELVFTGQSVMVTPKGEYLIELDDKQEAVVVVEIDPLLALNKKVTGSNNLFEDRRRELYKL
jgi:predicted amidohydrolase